MERTARGAGLALTLGGDFLECSDRLQDIDEKLRLINNNGGRFVLVVMLSDDVYSGVKRVADTLNVITQCIKYQRIERVPKGLHINVLIKINAKIGGVNHFIKQGLGWVMEQPTMFMGIDCSLPEQNSMEGTAYHAVVGSVDQYAGQYACYVGSNNSKASSRDFLVDGTTSLLNCFKSRNGIFPSRIVIYRDGVSESQFESVVKTEIGAIHEAIESFGFNSEYTKVTMIICQKRHHTRFYYHDKPSYGSNEPLITNACPGICVDMTGDRNSIVSQHNGEFYITSHSPIQGTSKPCKYIVVYDEIGFKVSVLFLFISSR